MAEEAYRQAVRLRPNDWSAFNQLGAFLNGRRRFEEAREAFARVTQLTPDNTKGWNNLGSMELALGNAEAARRDWETSLGIAPTSTAYSNLATLAFFDGRYAQAARYLEEAVKASPNDRRAWANLGAALSWAPGERETAPAAYRRAVELAEQERKLNPRNASLLARLSDCYAMLGRAREARAALAEALSLAPQDAQVMFNAGEVYEHLGDRELAIRWTAAAQAGGHPRREIEGSPGLAREMKRRGEKDEGRQPAHPREATGRLVPARATGQGSRPARPRRSGRRAPSAPARGRGWSWAPGCHSCPSRPGAAHTSRRTSRTPRAAGRPTPC
jgi:Flp pilus assembly protein TadD